MKKCCPVLRSVLFTALVSSVHFGAFGQTDGVLINYTGATRDNSAVLEASSTQQGILAPRMTQAQRNAIASPANSLLIYQTDNTPGYYYYDLPNTTWHRLFAGSGAPVTGSGVATRVAFWDGTNSLSSNANLYWDNTNSRLGIGTAAPEDKLELVGGALTLSNAYLDINRDGFARSGISWYSKTYPGWSTYMAQAGQTSVGPHGNLTAPAGAYVTSWALRSYIENIAGYGWTFESAAHPSTTPAVRFEILSNNGTFHGYGDGRVDGVLYAGAHARMGTGIAAGYYQDATNGAYRSIVSAATTNGYFFQTNAGGTTTMYVGLGGTYNGRVGIGTTTPNAALQLAGNNFATFGPNSTWGATLRVGGNGNVDNNASVAATNGNLHIDAASGAFATYLNYYRGTSGVIFGNGASGTVGSVSNTGYLTMNNAINSQVGYRVGGAAPSGQYLRGNGTDFVSSPIQPADIDYGNSSTGGPRAQGNFGQFQPHATYTDFNTNPAYWGWNYVQGNTNAPNTSSTQWYRNVVSLGDAYPARGGGGYSLELAFPRFNHSTAGVWMRTVENGGIGVWTRIDAGPNNGNFIQNQFAAAQTAEFRVSGRGHVQGEFYYNGWIRHMGAAQSGLYWQEGTGTGWHIYPESTADMMMRTGSGNGGIKGTIGDATARGYVHWTTTNEIGFLNASRSWSLRVDNAGNSFHTASSRAPIFYDSDNTAFYMDGAGTSNLNTIIANANIYNAGWYRGGTSDNGHVRLYGNTRTMVFRTDNQTAYGNNGAYPFIWNYGGDDASNRRMILANNGDIWTASYGWLGPWVSGQLAGYIPNNGSGDWQIASNSNATGYPNATLELRETNFLGAGQQPPRLSFHWGGVVASQIAIENNGTIAIRNNPGTGYEKLRCLTLRSNGFIEPSDERLKKDISSISGALDKVLSMRGVTYGWRQDIPANEGLNDKMQYGLIAQELEKVIPELVHTDEEGWKSVEYGHLVPVLIEALKEQQTEIEALRSTVVTDRADIQFLKQYTRDLEARINSITAPAVGNR